MKLQDEIETLIDNAIAEDIRSGDLSSTLCIPNFAETSGNIRLKQSGVIAGLFLLPQLFKKIDTKLTVKLLVDEGSWLKTGTIIAKIAGSAQSIMAGERIALNLIQHASGVSTQTAAYVKKVAGTGCEILDTRRTLPGLRALEKYAVTVGGGVNHRFGLDDRIVIKNNHLSFMAAKSKSPIQDAAKKARKAHPSLPLEFEVVNLEQMEEALKTDATAIILNRMTLQTIRRACKLRKKSDKKIYLQSQRSITLETVRAYAETGIDGILLGSLTYSVEGLDMGMRLSL